jgi:Tol biopolymer transport system component
VLSAVPDLYVASADGTTVRTMGVKTWCCPSWSPNGRFIAYGTSDAKGYAHGVGIVDVASGRVRQLTSALGDWMPRWSPDGAEIAFMRDVSDLFQDLAVMRVDGSRIRVIARGTLAPIFEWSRR